MRPLLYFLTCLVGLEARSCHKDCSTVVICDDVSPLFQTQTIYETVSIVVTEELTSVVTATPAVVEETITFDLVQTDFLTSTQIVPSETTIVDTLIQTSISLIPETISSESVATFISASEFVITETSLFEQTSTLVSEQTILIPETFLFTEFFTEIKTNIEVFTFIETITGGQSTQTVETALSTETFFTTLTFASVVTSVVETTISSGSTTTVTVPVELPSPTPILSSEATTLSAVSAFFPGTSNPTPSASVGLRKRSPAVRV